jgi:hypothetical protein
MLGKSKKPFASRFGVLLLGSDRDDVELRGGVMVMSALVMLVYAAFGLAIASVVLVLGAPIGGAALYWRIGQRIRSRSESGGESSTSHEDLRQP